MCACVSLCVHLVAHSGTTLHNPMDCIPPASSARRIIPARTLASIHISSSRRNSQPMDQTQVSCISCTDRWILYHCVTWETFHSIRRTFKECMLFCFSNPNFINCSLMAQCQVSLQQDSFHLRALVHDLSSCLVFLPLQDHALAWIGWLFTSNWSSFLGPQSHRIAIKLL